MATVLIMPKQGQSVETCIITKWYKGKGDNVSSGDIIMSYETDKAAFYLESPADGILLDRFFDEGDEVPVLTNIAVIGSEGESTESYNPVKRDEKSPHGRLAADNKPVEKPEYIIPGTSEGIKIRISPRARRLATEKQIDFTHLSGTGPNGRIIISDIENLLSGNQPIPSKKTADEKEFSDSSLSNMRKLIANAMYRSLNESAQVTHHMSADVRRLLEARKAIKERIRAGNRQQDITLNDMICRSVIKALEKFPAMNSHLLDNTLRTFNPVHLGFAVDTERGLMVPAIRDAGSLGLEELSGELKKAADACRKGNIDPELIRSDAATFTVSNLGGYGVEMFTPVINLPQTGILGVCTIINRPADLGNNTFGFIPFIGLSLTYDHRAVDGGPATLFLKEIKEQIESFTL